MKKPAKKILSLCMAVVMVAGMAATAFAAETRSYFVTIGMAYAPYRITNVLMDNASYDMSDNPPPWYQIGETVAIKSWEEDMIGSVKITKDSIITLEFYGHDGIVLTPLENDGKDLKLLAVEDTFGMDTSISDNSEYVTIKNDVLEEDEYGEKHYNEGMTVQFKKEGTYILSVKAKDGQTGSIYDMFAPIICEVTTEDAPNKMQATPTSSKVLVNGTDVEFDAYTINGNNYFKLRDVAKVVSGSAKQFEVTWDGTKNAINLVSSTAYTVVGGELEKGDGATKNAVDCTSAILKDGNVVALTAYTINGNNYFKLRDLGQSFNFDVSWDGGANSIVIDTAKSYTAD